MASGSKFTFTDLQNPLFLNPSDGPTSISVTKLQGAADYRSWKRSFEIQLSSKRKLGFIDGSVVKNTEDATEAAQWETCNNMVISWIHNSISDAIKRSVLFINSASEIWKQLEKRFSLTNGSRKYKLTKDLFALRQNTLSVNDYFTAMSALWEEIDSMSTLPVIKTITTEITDFLQVVNTYKEESRLFQFLNGLNEVYGPQRSQLLMQVPLPTVDVACSALQQEESQRDILHNVLSLDTDISAMYGKGPQYQTDKPVMCTNCGGKNHPSEKCWSVVGFPRWHHRYRPPAQRKHPQQNSWAGNKSQAPKMANAAQGSRISSEQPGVMVTSQQLEKLLKLIPTSSFPPAQTSETDDELDYNFSGMVLTGSSAKNTEAWIMDSGATDHMTSSLQKLINIQSAPPGCTINLPTGDTTLITHVGDIILPTGLKLLHVLYVPQFTHNLLSIHKLAKDNACDVMFYPDRCLILDSKVKSIRGIGLLKQGLYYLNNDESTSQPPHCLTAKSGHSTYDTFNLRHIRLGHASNTKLAHIPCVKPFVNDHHQVCITCPMSKFTKLPYKLSDSHSTAPFELVHTDIWGPYKVPTKGKFRYFLTLVDDFSRMTWVYLLQFKSDYYNTLLVFLNYVSTLIFS